jgi:hypothetical protein
MGQHLVAVSADRYPAILAVIPVPMGARPTTSANPSIEGTCPGRPSHAPNQLIRVSSSLALVAKSTWNSRS